MTHVDPYYGLMVLLRQTKDAVYKVREKELNTMGLSPSITEALFIIRAIDGPATPSEISRWLFREPHSGWELLERMEKRGLVSKTKDLERKNLVRVSMTDKGQQALDSSLQRRSIHRIFSSLSDEQREQLTSCLELLLTNALAELRMDRPPFPSPEGQGVLN